MIDALPTLVQLLKQIQQVPYCASRNVYRITNYFLELDQERLTMFCNALQAAKEKLSKCSTCFSWQERTVSCVFCSNPQRDQSIICVVETWYDLWALERVGSFKGVYHVLGGAINPLHGIGPDNLTIPVLLERVKNNVQELILALNQTPEGEATAAYIARKLEQMPITITCLARGVPVGATVEGLDRLTLHKALHERRSF